MLDSLSPRWVHEFVAHGVFTFKTRLGKSCGKFLSDTWNFGQARQLLAPEPQSHRKSMKPVVSEIRGIGPSITGNEPTERGCRDSERNGSCDAYRVWLN